MADSTMTTTAVRLRRCLIYLILLYGIVLGIALVRECRYLSETKYVTGYMWLDLVAKVFTAAIVLGSGIIGVAKFYVGPMVFYAASLLALLITFDRKIYLSDGLVTIRNMVIIGAIVTLSVTSVYLYVLKTLQRTAPPAGTTVRSA